MAIILPIIALSISFQNFSTVYGIKKNKNKNRKQKIDELQKPIEDICDLTQELKSKIKDLQKRIYKLEDHNYITDSSSGSDSDSYDFSNNIL